MWIFLNDAFLSIIEPPKGTPGNKLLVRARAKGVLERVFGPDIKVARTPTRDYLFRAMIDRDAVATVIATNILAIDYGNFKDSIPDEREFDLYHKACGMVWKTMHGFQYQTLPQNQQTADDFAY
jgi:hypothetical protein